MLQKKNTDSHKVKTYMLDIWIDIDKIGICKSHSFWNNCMTYDIILWHIYTCDLFCYNFAANNDFRIQSLLSKTLLLSWVLRFGIVSKSIQKKLNTLFYFLILNTSLKSSPWKFSKHVDRQEVHIKEKNEGKLFLALFDFSI